jgi:ubiquitin conjugation factor E4 B
VLARIVRVYTHFAHSDVFASAVAADGRAYRPQNFARAAKLLREKAGSLTPGAGEGGALPPLDVLEAFAARAAAAFTSESAAEDLLGDVPDEFEDPIMGTLMTDPLTLPSGNIIDRSVLERHLLSAQTDPFTRAHLTIDQATPNEELRSRIEAWKAMQMSRKPGDPPVVVVVAQPPDPPAVEASAAAPELEPASAVPQEETADGSAAGMSDDDAEEDMLQQALALSLAGGGGS